MNRPPRIIPAMTAAAVLDRPDLPDVRAVAASVATIGADLRAVVAALGGEDDPTLRERLDRVLDRVTKIEEAIALLMDRDVEDVPLPTDPQGVPGSGREAVTAGAAGFTDDKRAALADEGKAMPNDENGGSFPIENIVDLHNAIRAIGRAKDPAAAKRHIRKRARELGAEDELPDTWE